MVLILSALMSVRKTAQHIVQQKSYLAKKLKLNSSYPTAEGEVEYGITNVAGGFGMMLFAGLISGLLGIGSGALKVVAMDGIMRIPFKVSTTTSNFMIGVTAAASAVVYLQRGYIDPVLSMPVVVGVLIGALTGSKILVRSHSSNWIRITFAVIISVIAIQMIYNGVAHKI
jgi:uncharacterized membrane protein YfcA